MPKRIGVWIDHAKAHLVVLENQATPEVVTIASDVEHRHKAMPTGSPAVPGQLHGAPIKRYEHRREQEKHRYYEQIVSAVRFADSIVIMGPGLAKNELTKEIRKHHQLAGRVLAVEPADKKLTPAQLVAKVRAAFDEPLPRGVPQRGPLSHTPHELNRGNGRAHDRRGDEEILAAQRSEADTD